MTAASHLDISRSTLEQLSALLLERAGLKVTPDRYYGLRLALADRMPALGLSDAQEYLSRLQGKQGEQELRALLPLVTVGKTDFFRDARQFEALRSDLLPDLLREAEGSRRAGRIWSAGCATGEEAYSLAMLCAELGATPKQISIWATDLNQAAIETAKLGRYPLRRMAGVDASRTRRFFLPTAGGYAVQPLLQEYITFEPFNLATPVAPRVGPSSLDIILCRNVIIYFDLPTIRSLMDRFLNALRPGGVLLLGYSESLFRVYDQFEMFEVGGTFAYRRPVQVPAASRRASSPPRPASRPPPSRVPVPAPEGMEPEVWTERAAQLMAEGDFGAALRWVEQITAGHPEFLEARITCGNLLGLMGRTDEAKNAFRQVLALEPLCLEARLFGGVAALQAGLFEEARQEFARALFLEPTLALGHYLLGGVLERMGELEAAQRSYRNAVSQAAHLQRPLAGRYPDLPDSSDSVARAARYALAALAELHRTES